MDFDDLLLQVRNCNVCAEALPLGAKPIVQASPRSKIVIIGQAPGTKAHLSGKPWNDASGIRLREWLQVTDEEFYDPDLFALVPMGFCYPGKASSGDLPPRKECAPLWHLRLLNYMEDIRLVLLVGKYAQHHYLGNKDSLTANVRGYADFLPRYFPLPHPSPRNFIWMNQNPWFGSDVLPNLGKLVKTALEI